MINIRRSEDRGGGDHGWLNTKHSFSFADYYDPEQMGYRSLRVINEDIIAPSRGFGMHPHKDMEIISFVKSGALKHSDNMGNQSVLRAGEFQRMTAGRGVLHSEFNDSSSEDTKLLQIWIIPEARGLQPSYEELRPENKSGLSIVASPDKRDGSMLIHQDVLLYHGVLTEGENLSYPVKAGRGIWIQLVEGDLKVGNEVLQQGDAAQIEAEEVKLETKAGAEFLLFDLK